MNFRSALAAPLMLISSLALAQSNTASLIEVSPATENTHFSVEGSLQAHSVAGKGSPWVGIAAAYHLLNWAELGLRGFLPLNETVDKSTYAIQALARATIIRAKYTSFFLEPDYSQNFYRFQPFNSYGLAVGGLSRVTPGISLGLSGGVEVASVVLDSIGIERRNASFVYPKVALLADLAF